MSSATPPEFKIYDADRGLRLRKGAHLSFGPDHWINPKALFFTAACARESLGGPVLCQNILPGVDLCASVRAENEDVLRTLWPEVEQFMHDWIETGNGKTQHLWFRHQQNWVCLCRHGAETFEELALTIERVWPSSVANAMMPPPKNN